MQGLLLLNKPTDMTSFSAVARVRRLCNTKRVGHTGTLDPMATGVLPVFIGRPTVLCGYLSAADKTYRAQIKLGLVTDTYDITGSVLRTDAVNVTKQQLQTVLQSFVGNIKQLPPMYSAIKKDGVRLYDLARRGVEVEREYRNITIHSINLLQFEGDTFEIEVHCSKGTYIRSLAYDIGQKLGTGAVLTKLCRTKTGPFLLENCVDLAALSADNIQNHILSEETAVLHFPVVSVTEKQGARFSNGGELSLDRLHGIENIEGIVRVRYQDLFLGLGKIDRENKVLTVECGVNFIRLSPQKTNENIKGEE